MYGVTEVFRFYGGPIDRAVDGVEGLVNTWPLDEAYIDYVEGDSESGIVNDPVGYPTIDPSVLTAANENGGETNVATGWHAIEFLLWGQDLDTEGPGARPATDYSTAPNADRRGQYLAVLSDLLLVHLGGLVEEWEPDQDNYRTEFLALDTDQALGMILTGMGELTIGELAGERLTVAYEERSQEDEQSCFSDNTTNDYLANIAGIEAVANGTFESVSGVGIVDAIAVSDADAADRLSRSIDVSKAAAESIEPPLDQYLVVGIPDSDPGRVAMLSTIEALEAQAIAIASAATVLGVEVG
jgi:putative iron-regulated protein